MAFPITVLPVPEVIEFLYAAVKYFWIASHGGRLASEKGYRIRSSSFGGCGGKCHIVFGGGKVVYE